MGDYNFGGIWYFVIIFFCIMTFLCSFILIGRALGYAKVKAGLTAIVGIIVTLVVSIQHVTYIYNPKIEVCEGTIVTELTEHNKILFLSQYTIKDADGKKNKVSHRFIYAKENNSGRIYRRRGISCVL